MDFFQLLLARSGENTELVERVKRSVEEKGLTYEASLIEAGVPKEQIRQLIADYYGIEPFIVPEEFAIKQDVLRYVSVDSARHYRIMPLQMQDGILLVGVNDPDNIQMREALNFISTQHGLPHQLVYMLEDDISRLYSQYDNLKGDVKTALDVFETELQSEIEVASTDQNDDATNSKYEHIEEDAPITKIVATILRYAVDGGASDIHIEPSPTKVSVRFRVDGVLSTSLELPIKVHMAVVARVKILSSMRLDERRRPQDGRFSATFDGRKIDFRVSVLPTNHGEKVVMRILDTTMGVRSLSDSGISGYGIEQIKQVVQEPYGIILISGPTGSGKSTTLRGMIKELDIYSKNVMSLEDPVEYNMEGVSQSQMRPEIGYTFANGLRAALRQDPDIIMVGEIRDTETAKLAIQAALTGHLVLSTIHTNNSIGVIPRLIDMGVDPYLIAPTLKMAISQRLARTLCKGTGREEPIDKSTEIRIRETFKTLPNKYHDRIPQSRTVLHPVKTPNCSTGYRGRTAITEVLVVNEEIQELILKNASEEEFYHVARKNGFITLQEDAIIKALNHEIPFEEMNVFSTKIGLEATADPVEDIDAVDNFSELEIADAIMKDNETVIN